MGEVEANLQINHRLAHHAKAEMARLDDTGVHRPDGNFVYAFTPDRQKGKRRAIVLQISPVAPRLCEAGRSLSGQKAWRTSGRRSGCPVASMPNISLISRSKRDAG